MARPQKQTVDYFPHFVNKGKTKLILRNEFGNDGYAFWYQLLELLCASDKQVYDYNNPAAWKLLLAETHVTEDIAVKILQLLADLRTIDPELHQHKIIWCQNLVENLELVYRRRATGIPERPVIVDNNPVKVPVIVNNNPHTKLNNTKLNNTKQEYALAPPKKDSFSGVLLTKDEYQKLVTAFGEAGARDRIEGLSLYIKSHGVEKKYKSHYATILNWERMEQRKGANAKPPGRHPGDRVPAHYTKPEDLDVAEDDVR